MLNLSDHVTSKVIGDSELKNPRFLVHMVIIPPGRKYGSTWPVVRAYLSLALYAVKKGP